MSICLGAALSRRFRCGQIYLTAISSLGDAPASLLGGPMHLEWCMKGVVWSIILVPFLLRAIAMDGLGYK